MKYGSLRLACESNDFAQVQRLLDEGAGVNEVDVFKWTPLMHAVTNGNAQITKLLIERKANVHLVSNSGKTPLMAACAQGSITCIDLLMIAGSNMNAENYGTLDAISFAVMNRKIECVQRLFDWGFKDRIRDWEGWIGNIFKQRRVVKDIILFVQTLLRKRLRVCKDMAGEIAKKIWETRNDEKWTEERGGKKSKKKLR